MIKVGFSSLVCPQWDLATIVEQASSMGFDGVELRGLGGEAYLPLAPELASKPDDVRRLFQERNVELVALGAPAMLGSYSRREVARQKGAIGAFIELASKLACPFVCIDLGKVPRGGDRQSALSRIAEGLTSLVDVASRFNVTLLVENGGDFMGSRDLWYAVDAVDHPALRCCWNQCRAMTVSERPTKSIPRLSHKIQIVHICDAVLTGQGVPLEYRPLGEGDAEIGRQIELLKGVSYNGYLLFESPRLWDGAVAQPQSVLPDVAKFLREHVEASQPLLTAYKGDKRAPRLAAGKRVPA